VTIALAQIAKARSGGIKIPVRAYRASKKAGVPFYVTASLLMQESSGGLNVWGSDPTIFVGRGAVTKANYAEYKRERIASGNRLMQGCGPVQLTYYSIQDKADAQGGCWRPYVNLLTGLQILAGYYNTYGNWVDAARRYNGSGPAADAYAAQMAQRYTEWQRKLA